MDWKRAAIEDLRYYRDHRDSLRNIPERIEALKHQYEAIKCSNASREPVQGGTSRVEDSMLNNIVERERLRNNYAAAKRLVGMIQRGLAGLDDTERRVLDRFYIDRPKDGHVERLENELHAEKSTIYRIKEQALYRFTVCMYGLIDY